MKHEIGLFKDIPIEDYHRSAGISSSQIKYGKEALRLYKAYKDGEIQQEDTKATITGSAIHCAVLEPEKFDDIYAVVPGDVKKPTQAQLTAKTPAPKTIELISWWDKFNSDNQGKIQIKEGERDIALRVRDSVYSHPEAKEYFFEYDVEMSGWYMDQDFEHGEGTNMLCRYRPDLRTNDYIVDIKSTVCAQKEKFERQAYSLGYHISAAHYLDGDRLLKKTDHDTFVLIAVEKKPPYLVAVYPIKERVLDLGRWERRKVLNSIKKARDEDKWPGYNNDVAVGLEFPQYAFYNYEGDKI